MPKYKDQNHEDENYQMYLDERKLLIETEFEQSSTLDKALLTISTGVFGLSVTFTDKMIKTQECKFLLITAWILFCTTILLTLYSFFFSQKAMRKQIDVVYSTLVEGKPLRNKFSCVLSILNNASIISLTCGIVFLAIFVVINI